MAREIPEKNDISAAVRVEKLNAPSKVGEVRLVLQEPEGAFTPAKGKRCIQSCRSGIGQVLLEEVPPPGRGKCVYSCKIHDRSCGVAYFNGHCCKGRFLLIARNNLKKNT